MIALLAHAPTPTALRTLDPTLMGDIISAGGSPRLANSLPAKIVTALDAQSLTIPATAEFGRVIAGVAAQLRDVRTERVTLAAELEARLDDHPLASVLTSMPGIGVRTATKILTIIGDGSASPTAGHLASHAAAPTSCTPCSATARPTRPRPAKDTPQAA